MQMPDRIPKTPATHELRTRLHRAYSLAGLAAWEGDLEAAEKHAAMARALAAAAVDQPEKP